MLHKQTFTVDAALLKELGERLIGRSHIALAELIKNAYDADASTCRIEFGEDQIVISDDGTGMSEKDFLTYWMRIGTTHKIEERVSKNLHRPLTGSKGIGRLSVQFLADEMELESTTAEEIDNGLYAIVDWTGIISGNDLNTVSVLWERRRTRPVYPQGCLTGTRITLRKLKAQWDAEGLRELGDEVWMLRSPFRRPAKTSPESRPEEFDIEIAAPGISNARESFDESLQNVFANWRARLRGSLDRGRTGGKATISIEFKAGYPRHSDGSHIFREVAQLPVRSDGEPLVDRAQFEILIFRPEGTQMGHIPVAELREYLNEFGNVSVYDAGFRLPYYGSGRDPTGQDWLSIALDQGRRLNASELLPERLKTSNRYMQDLPAPGRIFGAVNIDTNHEREIAASAGEKEGEWLRIQPGRDRLQGNRAFNQLRDLVRFSLDFYANRFRMLSLEATDRNRTLEPPSQKFSRALRILETNKGEIPASVFREVRREVSDAQQAAHVEEDAMDQRAALLAPLATAGMTALALNHELARQTRVIGDVGTRLRALAKKHSIAELAKIADQFDEALRRWSSLQELFAPLLSKDDIAATDRLKVRPIVDQVVQSMGELMPRVKFRVAGIPVDLRFPLGAFAEWNAVVQNLLANSWNAMLESDKAIISFDGGRDRSGREWLRISDTGKGLGVPLAEASKFFEPFARGLAINKDQLSIAIGGNGLGLAIVRMIAHRRSAQVAFVEPEEDFSTTFEISWRGTSR